MTVGRLLPLLGLCALTALTISTSARAGGNDENRILETAESERGAYTLHENGMEIDSSGRPLARAKVEMRVGALRIGSKVIGRNGGEYLVLEGEDQRQMLKVQSLMSPFKSEAKRADLALTEGCNGRLCISDRVVSKAGREFFVHGLFRDGTVAVASTETLIVTVEKSEDLALANTCQGTLCTADTVVKNNQDFLVSGFFPDGQLAMRSTLNTGLSVANPADVHLRIVSCFIKFVDRAGGCR